MAITVKVIKAGYGHKPGQVLTLNEFDAGHLMGFGFAVPFVEGKEIMAVSPPETRNEHSHEPIEDVLNKEEEKAAPIFFKRRGRRKKP